MYKAIKHKQNSVTLQTDHKKLYHVPVYQYIMNTEDHPNSYFL